MELYHSKEQCCQRIGLSFHRGVMVERNGGVAPDKMAMDVAFNIRQAAPIPYVERLLILPIRQTLR